ncbi:hypothetical protein [Tissierella sp.]|uniref:hypothetical protein n=1 Tax=Tissierella sp. TaxID=41274 RepID=UPI0028AD4426|nr:hypothetical protein [Tissierella sp.]
MTATLTVQDLFKLILFLLGIGGLTYLILVLRNISKLITQVSLIIEGNKKDIDVTLKQLPIISENISSITKSTDIALKDLTPEINNLVSNINDISGKVGSITDSVDSTTHKVSETFDVISDSISETAFAFQYNVKNIDNYIRLIVEIIETIRNAIKKK